MNYKEFVKEHKTERCQNARNKNLALIRQLVVKTQWIQD